MSLRTTKDGARLFCWPISELDSLVDKRHQFRNFSLANDANPLQGLAALDLLDLEISFQPGQASQIAFELPHVSLRYDVAKQQLLHNGVDGQGKPHEAITLDKLAPRDGVVKLRLLIDRLSVEAYAFGGEAFAAHYIYPQQHQPGFSIQASGSGAIIEELNVRELRSAWGP